MKHTPYDITDDLLVKYLTGETTSDENDQVKAWVAAHPDNRKRFEHFRFIWDESLQLAATSTVNEEDAWQRFQQRVANPPKQTPVPVIPISNNHLWVRIAAVLVVAAGLGWLSYTLLQRNTPAAVAMITVETNQQVRTDTLPDGTMVTSNKESALSYPQQFTGNERAVQLKGEAFFAVTPNKAKPFIIHTNDVTVKVVGTSFNVRNRDSITEVIVETGIVQVTHNGQTVSLHPGEKVLIKTTDSLLKKENTTDQLYTYYRSRKFVCDGTPLWKLAGILEEAYHVHITIERASLRNQPLTTTFENQSLDSILSIISSTFGITVVKDGNEIVLQ